MMNQCGNREELTFSNHHWTGIRSTTISLDIEQIILSEGIAIIAVKHTIVYSLWTSSLLFNLYSVLDKCWCSSQSFYNPHTSHVNQHHMNQERQTALGKINVELVILFLCTKNKKWVFFRFHKIMSMNVFKIASISSPYGWRFRHWRSRSWWRYSLRIVFVHCLTRLELKKERTAMDYFINKQFTFNRFFKQFFMCKWKEKCSPHCDKLHY